ncbi:hypothetical protein L345_07890, partial [Ophiophagus hannah]
MRRRRRRRRSQASPALPSTSPKNKLARKIRTQLPISMNNGAGSCPGHPSTAGISHGFKAPGQAGESSSRRKTWLEIMEHKTMDDPQGLLDTFSGMTLAHLIKKNLSEIHLLPNEPPSLFGDFSLEKVGRQNCGPA